MQIFHNLIQETPLFQGIPRGDLSPLLGCLGAATETIPKDGFALLAGDRPDHIGIVLTGRMQVERFDENGVRAILATLEPGDFYGEALACAQVAQSPVSVVATESSAVMKLDFQKILTVCANSCTFHARLVSNMVGIIARKNLVLQERMEILDRKTIRDRLLCYLTRQAARQGNPFSIPFGRDGLAEYLAVDRSALSREMGRLRDIGKIDFHKNVFTIIKAP